MKKIRFLFISLFFVLCSSVFAEDWYVCIASFKKKNNASTLVENLSKSGISTFISEQTVNDQLYYRVLYDSKSSDAGEARRLRDQLKTNSTLSNYKLSGFWICQAEKQIEIKIQAQEPEKVVLKKVENKSIPVSKEKPYSLKINSYKEEQAAVNDQKRLSEKEIDSYIVKSYDDQTYFNFDLHAGAFETPEQAEPLIKKIEDAGLPDPEISDYNKIAKSIEKYNEIVEAQEVTYQSSNDTVPETITPQIRKLIQQFPINKNYQIEEIIICDVDNARKNAGLFTEDINDKINSFITNEKIHAVSFASYHDSLYMKDIEIIMIQADNGYFKSEESEIRGEAFKQFAIKDDIINAVLSDDFSEFSLTGFNPSYSLMIMMKGDSFTKTEYEEFINDMDNDSSLLIYPQLRKTLLVLPDENAEIKRDFIMFNLAKVDEDYPLQKGFADWSLPMPGHWEAASYFIQNEEKLSVSFFDMDYDYNAKKIHQMFMDAHNESKQDSTNHPSSLELADSWYVYSFYNGGEVSFSTGSYIIAVDSDLYSELGESELVQMGRDLRIWNTVPKKVTDSDAK